MRYKVVVIVVMWFVVLAVAWLAHNEAQRASRMAAMLSLIGHSAADIPDVMRTTGSRLAGVYTRERDLQRDLAWFRPKAHVRFCGRVLYYRIGSRLGACSVLFYVGRDNTVYAVHFMEDAPRSESSMLRGD